jgi:hypothetical protein
MTTTVNLRKILDRKQWEFCAPAPAATAAGTFISSSRHFKQMQYYLVNATTAWEYLPEEDAWCELPSPALGGTFAAGACGVSTPIGPNGTASAGTSATITTTTTINRDLRGFKIRITGGPCAGDERVIASNTIGSNSVITVATPFSGTITNASTYVLLTPRWWVFNAHTVAPVANQFKYYEYCSNTWVALANLPAVGAAWGTDGRMVATPSIVDNAYSIFTSGTATAGASTTLTNSAKNWTVNQWANAYQVRITAGTGLGQTRIISSNTATALTATVAWTTTPDATSQYVIEGCDDYIYLMGNNSVNLYRYSISLGTWTTLSPGVARAAAPGAAVSGHWIWGVDDASWNNESAILNGRRIYSFRGAAGAILDYYDIPSNAWTNAITYSPANTTFTTGSKYTIIDGKQIWIEKEATNRFYRFDPVKSEMEPGAQFLYVQGAAVVGDTCFDVTYTDGGTSLTWIYIILNTSQVMLRMLLI